MSEDFSQFNFEDKDVNDWFHNLPHYYQSMIVRAYPYYEHAMVWTAIAFIFCAGFVTASCIFGVLALGYFVW